MEESRGERAIQLSKDERQLLVYRVSRDVVESRLPAKTAHLRQAIARERAISAFRAELEKASPSTPDTPVLALAGLQGVARTCFGKENYFFWIAKDSLRWVATKPASIEGETDFVVMTEIKSSDALLKIADD